MSAATAWRAWSLSRRLSAVFAVLLLACCGASAWLQTMASVRQEREVTQRLSLGLAAHIAGTAELMRGGGLDPAAVRGLFDKLMAVNPSVEVYLLDREGRIVGQAAPAGHLKRDRVDLAPVRALIAGAPLPITGDDPRGSGAAKVFSAAPLTVDGRDAGYVYVVLSGEDRDAISAHIAARSALRTTLWSMALVALLGLIAGLAAFRLITRPLRELAASVQAFERASGPEDSTVAARAAAGGDEIALLEQSFVEMRARIAHQLQTLAAQDRQRRELFANVSHDLRTPLTSLHGYLETLLLKDERLDAAERRRYLDIALGQSRKVGRLAQELFELARLEYGVVEPEKESVVLPDLVQDVFQKFELAAQTRRQRLVPRIAAGLPAVHADLGMIERVLTNLLDNAIRHTPEGGEVIVQITPAAAAVADDAPAAAASAAGAQAGGVHVEISDSGPGIPPELRPVLFDRPAFATGAARGGGLGLMIVRRILQLHGSDIRLVAREGRGAVFAFALH